MLYRFKHKPLIITLLSILGLTACPHGSAIVGRSEVPCVCPGLPGRIGQPCETFPHDGNFEIHISCEPHEVNATGIFGDPVCRVEITSSDPTLLEPHPRFVDVYPGPAQDFVFETTATDPAMATNDTVTISTTYNGTPYVFTNVRVSDQCN